MSSGSASRLRGAGRERDQRRAPGLRARACRAYADRREAAPDPRRLAASLEEFVGYPAYDIDQLRQDLERFVFLLDGSDGEPLLASHRHEPAQVPGQPRIRRALRASTSFVLALRAAGAPR